MEPIAIKGLPNTIQFFDPFAVCYNRAILILITNEIELVVITSREIQKIKLMNERG
jgi:hypothetical protein